MISSTLFATILVTLSGTVPEPSISVLAGTVLLALGLLGRRMRRASQS
jgi:MYXO-CTERM domain-containing protein